MNAKISILLAETDIEVRQILEEALCQGGFQLEAAKNGSEAVAVILSRSADLRGLITEVNLGRGIDGWEVARRGREIMPSLPVVYISASDGENWASQGVPNSTFVAKPFAPAQIVTAISSLINDADRPP